MGTLGYWLGTLCAISAITGVTLILLPFLWLWSRLRTSTLSVCILLGAIGLATWLFICTAVVGAAVTLGLFLLN